MSYYDEIDPIGEDRTPDIKIDLDIFHDVEDIQIEGVDTNDYPEFSDAFIAYAFNKLYDRECTEDECIYLTETYPETVNELAYESLI